MSGNRREGGFRAPTAGPSPAKTKEDELPEEFPHPPAKPPSPTMYALVADDVSSPFVAQTQAFLPSCFRKAPRWTLEQARRWPAPHVCYVTSNCDPETLLAAIRALRQPGTRVTLVSPLLKRLKLGKERKGGIRIWNFSDPGAASNRVVKKIFDKVASGLILLGLAPLLCVLAIMVRSTSKGPAFFRQRRLGRDAKHFEFLKFRSMHHKNNDRLHRDYLKRFIAGEASREESSVCQFKVTEDPRITPLGKWLRRTSLDELPQFINVWKGTMSLVGPRPALDYEAENYRPWHHHRFETEAGITGLWQVYGRSQVPFDQAVFMDVAYAWSQSLWLDLRLLFRTIPAVMSGRGGY